MKKKLITVMEKVGTLMIDRRTWVTVITIAGALLALRGAESQYDFEQLSEAGRVVGELVLVLAKLLAVIGPSMGLVKAHSDRPPSGVNYKNPQW